MSDIEEVLKVSVFQDDLTNTHWGVFRQYPLLLHQGIWGHCSDQVFCRKKSLFGTAYGMAPPTLRFGLTPLSYWENMNIGDNLITRLHLGPYLTSYSPFTIYSGTMSTIITQSRSTQETRITWFLFQSASKLPYHEVLHEQFRFRIEERCQRVKVQIPCYILQVSSKDSRVIPEGREAYSR